MKRIVLIIGAITLSLVIIVLMIWLIIQQTTIKTGIQFITVPDAINAEINNTQYLVDYEKTIKLDPGDYHIKLSHDNFTTIEKDIVVTKNTVTKLYIALSPSNDEGRKLLYNSTMSTRLENIGGHNSLDNAKKAEEQYPFTKNLPITEKYYVITPCYGQDGNQAIGICIMLAIDDPIYREQAKTSLTKNGIDFSNVPLYFYQG